MTANRPSPDEEEMCPPSSLSPIRPQLLSFSTLKIVIQPQFDDGIHYATVLDMLSVPSLHRIRMLQDCRRDASKGE